MRIRPGRSSFLSCSDDTVRLRLLAKSPATKRLVWSGYEWVANEAKKVRVTNGNLDDPHLDRDPLAAQMDWFTPNPVW